MDKKEYKKKVADLFSFKPGRSKSITPAKDSASVSNQGTGESSQRDDKAMASTSKTAPVAVKVKKVDVVVIGAGLSGLSAAKELRAYDLDVLVLEARDRVGGRTLTKRIVSDKAPVASKSTSDPKRAESDEKDDDGCWVDLGGSYVGPTQDSVLNLIDELKLETYLVDDTMDIGYMRANRLSTSRLVETQNNIELRTRFSPTQGDPPFGNLFHWIDYVNMVRLIDACGRTIPHDRPWDAKRAREWDAMSWKQFVDENTWTQRVRDYFNNVFVTIDVCSEPNEISALWFLWYVSQCGGYGRSISTTNGGQERKIKGGTQQLSEGLLELIGRDRVKLNDPVHSIDQSQYPYVFVTAQSGAKYRAKCVICAISPHLLLKIHHEPALMPARNLLAQRSPMGQVAKVILYYDRPFWKEHNFSGCFLFDSVDRATQPVTLSLDETKPDGSHPAIIGFICARAWYEMRDEPDFYLGRRVARSYADMTGLEEFMKFKRIERFDWTKEQYSGGCYTSTQSINTLTKFGRYVREPYGRIYFAGTETAIKWSGYMDGAISAGKRAARQVLHRLGKLCEDEIWCTETESTTVPPTPFEYPSSHRYAPNLGYLVRISRAIIVVALAGFIVHKHATACTLGTS